MLKLPYITPRSGRFLIAVLLGIKLALLVWNAAVFDSKPYDVGHHSDRALFGGLRPGKMAYNPPPYYFPALLAKRPADVPMVERSSETIGEDEEAVQSRLERSTRATKSEKRFREHLIALLRYTNVFWVGLFYIAWIYYALPRLLEGFRGWFLVSLLLLALPGYQKLGAMTHPDNMFTGTAALAISYWLFLYERYRKSRPVVSAPLIAPAEAAPAEAAPAEAAPAETAPAEAPPVSAMAALPTEILPTKALTPSTVPKPIKLGHLLGFAVVIGLMALTRPFAAVPVAVLSVLAAVYVARSVAWRWKQLLPRLALIAFVVGTLSTSWYVYRWKASGEVTNAYRTGYLAKFEKRRENFNYFKYYTSLNLTDLIADPSRKMGDGDAGVYADTPLANSFFTLLYSEIWGDQWLYFSGPKMKDNKVWPKRLILTCALATPLIVLGLGALFLANLAKGIWLSWKTSRGGRFVARFAQLCARFERELTLLAITSLGAAAFVYWQGGPALLPGKNSTVKFIYIATLFPPTLALIFSRRVKPVTFNLLSGYFLLLYVAAFPFAMYWPR